MNEPTSDRSNGTQASPTGSILVIESDAKARSFFSDTLREEGYRVAEAADLAQARSILEQGRFDLVLSAERHQPRSLTLDSEPVVVVVVSENAADRGWAAIREGAYDYLVKPGPSERLLLVVRRALERRSLAEKIRHLEETIRSRAPFDEIVGTSAALTEVMKIVEQIARMNNTVLVTGEPGTGKKLIGRALHALSPRRDRPFTVVDCSAIPAKLRDGIFGPTPNGSHHMPGELIQRAHGGTLFLDGISELTPAAQQGLMWFLQEAERMRGNASTTLPDVRVIVATHRDLAGSVESGSFNEDLYYRLNVISLRVPPLRERIEDIPLLVRHFLRQALESRGGGQPVVSPRAMAVLTAHPWPENVRELENFIQRAVAVDRDGVLGLDDLPFSAESAADRVIDRAKKETLTLGELEREYVLEILAENGGSRKKTAAKLGITTATLWRKLKRFETGD